MIFTRIAMVFGLALTAALTWLAIIGFTPAIALVVTVVALLILVGGGNLIRSSPTGRRGPPGDPGGAS